MARSRSPTAITPTTIYAYDAVGNLTSLTDAMSHVTAYEYDALNRKTKEKRPDPTTGTTTVNSPTTIYGYDSVGNLTSITDPLSHFTAYEYDALSRKTKDKLPDPVTGTITVNSPITVYGYDKAGNRTSVEDPDHNITTYLYDNLYRLKQETNQLSQSRNYTYDANGNNL